MPVIPVLGRLMEEDRYEFEESLDDRVRAHTLSSHPHHWGPELKTFHL